MIKKNASTTPQAKYAQIYHEKQAPFPSLSIPSLPAVAPIPPACAADAVAPESQAPHAQLRALQSLEESTNGIVPHLVPGQGHLSPNLGADGCAPEGVKYGAGSWENAGKLMGD